MFFIQKKYKMLFASLCCCALAYQYSTAQDTYSKTYELGVGVNNFAFTLIVDGNEFVVATGHSGDTSWVSALTRFDIFGNQLNQNSFSDYVINASGTTIRTEKGFELAGHSWSLDTNRTRGLELLKINSDLEIVEQIDINFEIERSTNLPGILDFNEEYKVVYGSFIDVSPTINSGAVITIVDKAMDTIVNEIVFVGAEGEEYSDFSVFALQKTIDDGLIMIVQTRQRSDSPTGFSSFFEIVQFNLAGEVSSRIRHPNGSLTNQALVQDEQGGVYFYEQFFPFALDSIQGFEDQLGSLTKLSPGLDSVVWNFSIYDRDLIQEERFHEVLEIIEVKDKNLLASGLVRLELNGEGEQMGFICKFTPEGEMLWVREYGIPTPEEFVNLEFEGVLQSSRIKSCQELEDGRLLCIGETAYKRPENSAYRELWILMLDENGCLNPGCDATQVLTSTSSTLPTQAGRIFPNPVSDILHVTDVSFDTYVISDMMGRKVLEGGYTTEINLPARMPSGMYVLQLVEDSRLKSVFKFLKE